MNDRTWQRIERRLSRVLPSGKVASTIGDLAEDYSKRRAATSRIRARFWLAGEIRSIERVYRAHGEPLMSVDSRPPRHLTSTVIADARYTMRRWRRQPGVALAAIVILALGIGSTTAVFSVVDAVLLRPLPWTDADRLAGIYAAEPERLQRPAQAADWDRAPLGWREWEALQRAGAFEQVAAWMPSRFLYTDEAGAEIVNGSYISSNLLQTLGVAPSLGRTFTADEDRTLVYHVLISHALWQQRFGGADTAIGRPVSIALGPASPPQAATIVGVLPRRLRFQRQAPDVVLPLGVMAYNLSYDTNRQLRVLARIRQDVAIEQARGAARPVIGPTEASAARSARVVPLFEEEIGEAAQPLWLVLAGSGLLLLVACANVAGLLLGEARGRRHEIAVRLSLGGTAGRIFRQLTVEQLLLAITATAAGVTLAIWLTPLLVTLAPERLPRLDEVVVDRRIAALAAGVGLLTSLIFALAPAIGLARTPAAAILAEGSRLGGARRTIGQRLLVTVEFALALVLVAGASLFGETIVRMTARPLGFTPGGLVVASVMPLRLPPPLRLAAGAQAGGRFDRDEAMKRAIEMERQRLNATLTRLSALPDVVAVAGATAAPFLGLPSDLRVRSADRLGDPGTVASRYAVTEQYFRAAEVPILRGREFLPIDPRDRVIISAELERQLFDGSAVGRQIAIGGSPNTAPMRYHVGGVAQNTRQREYADGDRAAVYFLDRDGTAVGRSAPGQFLIRTDGDARALVPLVWQALRQPNDLSIVVTAVRTMDELAAASVAEPRFRATLATIFGASALVLAAVGLYGLATRRVEERRREISVRIALGAQKRDARRLVLRDALRTVGLGLALGLPAAFAASRITQTFLYGVSATSPHIFVLSSGVLVAAALAATIVPARRAAAADPIVALKE